MADIAVDTLITHSGSFHADDLLAYAVLSTLFPEATLVRTRDEARIAQAGPRAVVFDVGYLYEPERHRYDHHQPGKPRRPEGLAYSSFGLVWRHFGRDYVGAVLGSDEAAQPDLIEAIHHELDGQIVRDIDAVDNGELQPGQSALMHRLSLPNLLELFRPAFDDDRMDKDDRAFLDAARVATPLLAAQVRTAAAALRSSALVASAIATRSHPEWIELPRAMDYQEPILASGPDRGADRIRFVVLPSRDEWQIKTVNVSETSFVSRKLLPAAWAGLRGPDLVAMTGVPDAVFCHTGRFIAVARSREGAMALLDQALRG
jgi:uncharacterized UPF0160 family protein